MRVRKIPSRELAMLKQSSNECASRLQPSSAAQLSKNKCNWVGEANEPRQGRVNIKKYEGIWTHHISPETS